MAKESGIGMTVTVDNSSGTGQAITNDITSVSFGTTRSLQDVTGLNVSSMERLALLADGSFSPQGVFNDASNMSHAVLSNIATNTSTRTVAIAHSGNTLTMEMLFTGYNLSRGADGGLTWDAPAQLAATTSFGWT